MSTQNIPTTSAPCSLAYRCLCSNRTAVKTSLVAIGLLLVGGAAALYFCQLNAIVAYAVGGAGVFIILATTLASVTKWLCAKRESPVLEHKEEVEPTSTGGEKEVSSSEESSDAQTPEHPLLGKLPADMIKALGGAQKVAAISQVPEGWDGRVSSINYTTPITWGCQENGEPFLLFLYFEYQDGRFQERGEYLARTEKGWKGLEGKLGQLNLSFKDEIIDGTFAAELMLNRIARLVSDEPIGLMKNYRGAYLFKPCDEKALWRPDDAYLEGDALDRYMDLETLFYEQRPTKTTEILLRDPKLSKKENIKRFADRYNLRRWTRWAEQGNVQAFKKEIEQGSLTEPTRYLRVALYNGRIELVDLLLQNGADPSLVPYDNLGYSALHVAANFADNKIGLALMRLLLEHHPTLVSSRSNVENKTPLMFVAVGNQQEKFSIYREKIKLLLEFGSEVNAKDSYGNTSMHYAMGPTGLAGGCPDNEALDCLLRAGGDLTVTNNKGETPVDVARIQHPRWFKHAPANLKQSV